jgi:hypothetical protein
MPSAHDAKKGNFKTGQGRVHRASQGEPLTDGTQWAKLMCYKEINL